VTPHGLVGEAAIRADRHVLPVPARAVDHLVDRRACIVIRRHQRCRSGFAIALFGGMRGPTLRSSC
jgi:hypothetical protein